MRDPDGEPLFDLYDVSVLNDVLAVKYENEYRAHRKAMSKGNKRKP